MKKKIIIVNVIVLLVVISSITIFSIRKNIKEQEAQKRYEEIKESAKKGVEWNLRAKYPRCKILKEVESMTRRTYYNSSFLINNGYIKQNELLDVDEVSYCDVYVIVDPYIENSSNNNCETHYKIHLKCKDYEDDGYIDLGMNLH